MVEWPQWVREALVAALTTLLYLILIGILSFRKRRRADHPDLSHTTASSPQASFDCLLPSPVPSLSAEAEGRNASVTLKWTHPTENWSEVNGYEIRYKKLPVDDNTRLYGLVASYLHSLWYDSSKVQTLPRNCKTFTLMQDDGIEPLNEYLFQIRPTCGYVGLCTVWTSTVVFIRWYCHFPGCVVDRRKRCSGGSISDFCSSDHAKEFCAKYCLLPGCHKKRCEDYHFCTREHLEEATRQGCSGLVPLEQSCKDYRELQKHFSKTWCKEKGQQPKICSIFKVVNPSLEQRLNGYLSSIPWLYRKTERYYHGTQLHCDLSEYLQPCSTVSCGICGITKKGFDPDRISSSSWQRFGRGFYLAPNSSKSYDYPLSGRAGHTQLGAILPYRALLVCDVVPGRKKTLHNNDPSLQGPPAGYHSVFGKAKWLWFRVSPHLNYDELVVFNPSAVRPSFILLCENLVV